MRRRSTAKQRSALCDLFDGLGRTPTGAATGRPSPVSFGHADKIAAVAAGASAAGKAPPIDPALYQREDVRRILAERDIGALYRVLKDDAGLTQRMIAELVGMSQSEVSEILAGRRVKQVDVLERICDGLGIERGWMRLGSADAADSAYAREDEAAWKAVTDEMRRRALLAAAGAAALSGHPLLGELLSLPAPPEAPLPSRLGMADVVEVDSLTGHRGGRHKARLGHTLYSSSTAIAIGCGVIWVVIKSSTLHVADLVRRGASAVYANLVLPFSFYSWRPVVVVVLLLVVATVIIVMVTTVFTVVTITRLKRCLVW